VAFHDLQRAYLQLHAEAAAWAHEQLLTAHDPDGDGWCRLDRGDPYLWNHLTYHLAVAGRHHELAATVTDPAWLAVRISHDGTLAAERDVSDALRWELTEGHLLALLRRLQQTAHLLDRASGSESIVATLVWDVVSGMQRQVLEGHTGGVNAVAWSPMVVGWRRPATMGRRGCGMPLEGGETSCMVVSDHVLSVDWSAVTGP
jgi:hypothetical protein